MYGLRIVKKTLLGVTLGYVVGWYFYPRRYLRWDSRTGEEKKDSRSFRSIRNGLIFDTEEQAREFRDGIEKGRKTFAIQFEDVD